MPQYSIRIECCFWFYKLTSTEKKLEQITGDIIIFIDTCVMGEGIWRMKSVYVFSLMKSRAESIFDQH